jgi:hypothetical protein
VQFIATFFAAAKKSWQIFGVPKNSCKLVSLQVSDSKNISNWKLEGLG